MAKQPKQVTAYAKDIAASLAEKLQLPKKDAMTYVEVTINLIVEELTHGNKVSFSEIGTFKINDVKEKKHRNPKTGEAIIKPAHKKLKFTPSKSVKAKIN